MQNPMHQTQAQEVNKANAGFLLSCTLTFSLLLLNDGSVKAQHQIQLEAKKVEAGVEYGQLPNAVVWLKPADFVAAPTGYLGNYPVYAANDAKLTEALSLLASQKAGTLFMAGRFPQTNEFMRFGAVTISATTATAGQHHFAFDSIAGTEAILKLSYSISPKFKGEVAAPVVAPGVNIAEIIFIDRLLSDEEARAIESYLALKYSINITANTESEKRKYVYGKAGKVWNYPADFRYDKAVYGLGRNDALDFYQTQTRSAESEHVVLSFTEKPLQGAQPTLPLADNSALIMAQLNDDDATAFCGGAPSLQPYKMRVYGWQEKEHPEFAYLWLDSVYTFTAPPVLLNGNHATPLEYTHTQGGTQLKIPIVNLSDAQDYFIAWGSTEEGCKPIGRLDVYPCGTATNAQNALNIHVEESGLPATIELTALHLGETYTYPMNVAQVQLANVAPGPYQLMVYNNRGMLVQNVLQLPDCGQGTARAPQLVIVPQSATAMSTTAAAQRSITAYPNPVGENQQLTFVFSQLDDVAFDVVISDVKGAVVGTATFTPTTQQNVYTYAFRQKGSYQVLFTSPEFTEVKQIIVQ